MKVGIACENFKVPRFEKELTAAGFEFKTTLGKRGKLAAVAAIVVECADGKEAAEVGDICTRLTAEFFHRN